MFGSSVLEVAIGMVLVYLLLSIVCSALKEWLSSVLRWRATTLEQGISDLFQSPEGVKIKQALYNHPLIKGLTQQGKLKVSYIPGRLFTLALLDIVAPAGAGGAKTFADVRDAIANHTCPEIKGALLPLADTANEDMEKLRRAVRSWFDDSMERVSGLYKARAQMCIVVLAALVCVSLNADSITISRSLWESPTTRALVVKTAEQAAQTQSKGGEAAFESLKNLGLPIGWSDPKNVPKNSGERAMKVIGLLLTISAVSLNAPFWFDLLNKLVNLRLTGKRPETEDESAAKKKKAKDDDTE